MEIAIIGGGFSGLSLIAHLFYHSESSISVKLIEKSGNFGQGIAYSTEMSWHLLNVRASEMGAFDDDPEHFYHWVISNENHWRQKDLYFQNLHVSRNEFLPRKLYQLYLLDLLQQMKQRGSIEFIQNEVLDLAPGSNDKINIIFDNGEKIAIDKVVLAIGVLTTKKFHVSKDITDKYHPNIWEYTRKDFEKHISKTDSNSKIVIIGTGLTMVDMVSTLYELQYQGKIFAISTDGLLPLTHSQEPLPKVDIHIDSWLEGDLLHWLSTFRRALRKVEKKGGHWSQLIDGLRLYTTRLWQQLSLEEKKIFLARLMPFWNKHRHRIANQCGQILDELMKVGRLQVIPGKVISIQTGHQCLEVAYKMKSLTNILKADQVYNCTGPEYRLQQQPNPLLQNLLKRGWILPDSLGLGIQCDASYHAIGPMSDKIFVMGSLLFGELFETTAVPELRHQANVIASQLRK